MNDDGVPATDPDAAARLNALIRDLLAELHPSQRVPEVTAGSVLDRDLGIDSLSRMELVARIEHAFAIALKEDVFGAAETVTDLLHAIRSARPVQVSLAHAGDVPPAHDAPASTPRAAQTLLEVLDWHVITHPDRPHIRLYSDHDAGEAIAYRRLDEDARSIAGGLQACGVRPGARVVIMLPTGVEYFSSFLGILHAGAIPVPIYPPARRGQLADHLQRQSAILDNAQAAALITVADAIPVARLLQARVPSLRAVVTVADLNDRSRPVERPPLAPDDIAFLQYTSGSTGHPKGVVLTHRNLLANIRADGERIAVSAADVFVSWLPLYHDMGLIGAWLGSMYHSVPLVVMSPMSFLARPKRWLWAIHRHRGTLAAAPNFAYELCVSRTRDEDLTGLDLSTWRVAFNGAESVSAATIERFCRRFEPYGFRREAMYPVYGLAESAVGLAFPAPGQAPLIDTVRRQDLSNSGAAVPAPRGTPGAFAVVSCGTPLAGHEIRIVDARERELPERRQGRVQFRGPSATRGYFRNPAATRALIRGGWLESGDLGYIADGNLYVTGRSKDVVIRAGRNIYPEELEQAVSAIEGVRDGRVAVFASPDPATGAERLVVLAETHARDAATRDRLRQEIIGRTTDLTQTAPDEVVLAPGGTVLKTSSGKLRRADMRRLFEKGAIGRPRRALHWQLALLALGGLVPRCRYYLLELLRVGYAGYAWAAFAVIGSVAAAVVALLPGFERRWRAVQHLSRVLGYVTGTPLTIRGEEHVPREEACIFVANHASYIDSYVLAAACPRPVRFVAKAELTAQPVLYWLLGRLETLFVERFDVRRAVAGAGAISSVIRTGRAVLFFPEGTFMRAPGLLPFHMGAFVTAAASGAPIVPIVVRGTRAILRAGSWFPRRGRVTVSFGPPVHPTHGDGTHVDDWAIALKLRAAVRDHMLRHGAEPDLSEGSAVAP